MLCSCPRDVLTGVTAGYAAAVERDKFWIKRPMTLNVGFMPGYPDYFRQRIVDVITGPKGWQSLVGKETLRFDFAGTGSYDILITQTDPASGRPLLYWSYVGTDSLAYAAVGQPSMCLGFLSGAGYAEKEIDRLILHEFGHALGLIHEQSHPRRAFRLKPAPVVYEYFRATYGVNATWVDQNVLAQFTEAQTTLFKPFDPASVMMYELPPQVAEPPMRANHELSPLDVETIQDLYGKKGQGGRRGVTLEVGVASGDFAIRHGYDVLFNFHAEPGRYVAFNLFANEYLDLTQGRPAEGDSAYWRNVNPFGSLVFQRIVDEGGTLRYDTTPGGRSDAATVGELRYNLRKEAADVKRTLAAMKASGGGTYMVFDVAEERDEHFLARTMTPDAWAWFQVKVARVR